MKISKVTLHNFRIYKGTNEISFAPFSEKNISIIAGKNGYGKTTFLTSLIWSFYGKLMSHVEAKYRKEIKTSGGYQNYIESLLNRDVKLEEDSEHNFYVEIELKDISIPSLPCDSITIKRSYDVNKKKEDLSILIDGIENELTKDVGYDLFINDFILPREIAKFFFFDAEKIVSLAEAESTEELRSLSRAYSEVLGIKKYEELKKNLESLLTKLLRKGVSDSDRNRLEELISKEAESAKLLEYNLEQQEDINLEISKYRQKSNQLQEKLIREGNDITLDELKELKRQKEELKNESTSIRKEISSILEFTPLVIAGKKLIELKKQLDKETAAGSLSKEMIQKEIEEYSKKVIEKLSKAGLGEDKLIKCLIDELDKEEQKKRDKTSTDILIAFSEEQNRNFNSIYQNIKGTYLNQFKAIVQREKNNRILFSRTSNKIKQAEARKDNHLAKKIREEKISIDNKVIELVSKNEELLIERGNLLAKNNSDKKVLSEFEKNFNLLETDKKKYEATEVLLDKINNVINRIKEDKKYALQKALSLSLDKLMHKEDFIENIQILIEDDVMKINLLDKNNQIIDKNLLSKGEQQLYATALLKALVDESGKSFPVFIDSPLQKFDKYHSKNIIEEFYPSISSQVVLLPLLEKELTEKEFSILKPNLHRAFIIENSNDKTSSISQSNIERVFEKLQSESYV